MSLAKKIGFSLLSAIVFITMVNMVSFYYFYKHYINIYLTDKITSRQEITLDYINSIIEKQTNDEVDEIFDNIEIEFFELLEKNQGKIKLDDRKNTDIVIKYLLKAGVNQKYIEEIVPENYFEKILTIVKDNSTPEYKFLNKITSALLLVNFIAFLIIIISLLIFTKIIIFPITQTANKIKDLEVGKSFKKLEYNKKDEIGQLVFAINELNTKLNIQEEIRSKLVADISHELKTPITAIQCYLEGIKDKVIKLDEKTLNNITNEMHRLIKLVNKIMDYEKYDNSEVILKLELFPTKFLTENIINQFRLKLKENNQKVITSGVEKKLTIDKDSFTQIIQNILSNFTKYAGKGTILKIDFGLNYIKFSDNGVGVKKEELPYIKEKFYQSKNAKTGDIDDRGIGIGFSIMEKLIKAHGWDMEINSEYKKGFEIKIITKNSQ